MIKNFAIYKTPDCKKYKMIPSVEIFDRKTEEFIEEVVIKTLEYDLLKDFFLNQIKAFPSEPFIGSVDVTPQIGRFLSENSEFKEFDYNKKIYQISFDNVEYVD